MDQRMNNLMPVISLKAVCQEALLICLKSGSLEDQTSKKQSNQGLQPWLVAMPLFLIIWDQTKQQPSCCNVFERALILKSYWMLHIYWGFFKWQNGKKYFLDSCKQKRDTAPWTGRSTSHSDVTPGGFMCTLRELRLLLFCGFLILWCVKSSSLAYPADKALKEWGFV